MAWSDAARAAAKEARKRRGIHGPNVRAQVAKANARQSKVFTAQAKARGRFKLNSAYAALAARIKAGLKK